MAGSRSKRARSGSASGKKPKRPVAKAAAKTAAKIVKAAKAVAKRVVKGRVAKDRVAKGRTKAAGASAAKRKAAPTPKRPAKPGPRVAAPSAKPVVKPVAKPAAGRQVEAGTNQPKEKAVVAAAPTTPVPITEIGAGQCRFIVEERTVPALCCGLPAVGGSWCSQHLKIVYTPTALRTVRDRARAAALR